MTDRDADMPKAWRTHAALMAEEAAEEALLEPWRETLRTLFEKTGFLRSRRGNEYTRLGAQIEATQLLRDFVRTQTGLLIPMRPKPFDISLLEARQFFAGPVSGTVSREAMQYYTSQPEGRGASGFVTPSRRPVEPLAEGYWELLGVAELVEARGLTPVVYGELIAPFPDAAGNEAGFFSVAEVFPVEGAEVVTRFQLVDSDFFEVS